jgi:hypothetical protein
MKFEIGDLVDFDKNAEGYGYINEEFKNFITMIYLGIDASNNCALCLTVTNNLETVTRYFFPTRLCRVG